jgi:hypothetical protein
MVHVPSDSDDSNDSIRYCGSQIRIGTGSTLSRIINEVGFTTSLECGESELNGTSVNYAPQYPTLASTAPRCSGTNEIRDDVDDLGILATSNPNTRSLIRNRQPGFALPLTHNVSRCVMDQGCRWVSDALHRSGNLR